MFSGIFNSPKVTNIYIFDIYANAAVTVIEFVNISCQIQYYCILLKWTVECRGWNVFRKAKKIIVERTVLQESDITWRRHVLN